MIASCLQLTSPLSISSTYWKLKNLLYSPTINQQNPLKATPTQRRHLDYIAQFTTNIVHISGSLNNVADALSRIEDITSINYSKLSEAQQNDQELKDLLKSSTN